MKPRLTPGSQVIAIPSGGWRLEIPAGPPGRYRLAQLDDYASLPRRSLPQRPPLSLHWRLRASSTEIPGTWGFGLWNDPFGFSLGFGGAQRLPALPEAAWFFFASPQNHLSLRDDLPAHGGLAATFRSERVPSALLVLGAVSLPLLILPPLSRLIRRMARRFIEQDAANLKVNPVEWHDYALIWEAGQATFRLDGTSVLETGTSPGAPLGLVVWVDNQYAAWRPDGRLGWGTLANPEPAWIEIVVIQMT
jgi:hypothetical protein